MPNYKQSAVTGDRYTRAKRVILENPLGLTASATFIEQDVLNVGAETITRDLGAVRDTLDNPATSFPLVNPSDDSVVGESTYGDVYVVIYSLYRKLAADRDSANQS